jgi:uncharacterized protein YoxC
LDTQPTIIAAGIQLQSLCERLSTFLAGSEEVFLNTGAHLRGLEEQTRSLIEQSNRAAQVGSREGAGNPGSALEQEIALLEQHLVRSQSTSSLGIEVMETVLARVKKLLLFDDPFRMIVLTLRALASSIHIENAHTNLISANFDTVVSDVREMTSVIAPKFDAVLEHAAQVKKMVDMALSTARHFIDKQGKESLRLRGEASNSLRALVAHAASAEDMAHQATRDSGEVAKKTSTILLSLQVHDFSRQIIEHVAEGLTEFHADATLALQDESTTPDTPAWMAELSDVCRLETAQLHAARDKLVQGLREIDQSLRGMCQLADDLARRAGSLAGERHDDSLLDQVERSIGKAVQSLRNYLAHERQLIESLGLVEKALTHMAGLVQEVRGIGEDAKIVGLNAMVKACNAGREGHTLTVLAKAIQDISDDISSQSKSVADLMSEIHTATTRLFGDSGKAAASSTEEGESIAKGMECALSALRTYHAELSASVTSMGTGSGVLRSEVGKIAQTIGEMLERTEILREVADDLHGIGQTASEQAGSLPMSRRPTRKRSAAQRYTMESEREIHRTTQSESTREATHDSAQSTDGQVAAGEVELF